MLHTAGVITSPNYPANYPDNLEQTHMIQVEEGLILLLEFTAFNIQYDSICLNDHLTITDGDGTTLMGSRCGSNPPNTFTSRSNTVNLVFSTNWAATWTGWSLSWSAVAPGET